MLSVGYLSSFLIFVGVYSDYSLEVHKNSQLYFMLLSAKKQTFYLFFLTSNVYPHDNYLRYII